MLERRKVITWISYNHAKVTIINNLNEAFFKIKETLSRCGNTIYDINSKKEVENIFNSFINPQKI